MRPRRMQTVARDARRVRQEDGGKKENRLGQEESIGRGGERVLIDVQKRRRAQPATMPEHGRTA